jgi:hypothetical protein
MDSCCAFSFPVCAAVPASVHVSSPNVKAIRFAGPTCPDLLIPSPVPIASFATA